jgi:catechol 2,3-dioxygenase-like lactoylglutathione lyase family enzyme
MKGVAYAIHHVGISVRDLDRSLRFYADGLGLRLLYQRGPISAPYFDALVGLDKVIVSSALLVAGRRHWLELVQYHRPLGDPVEQDVHRPGTAHVAFEVADIVAATSRLSAMGTTFRSAPQIKSHGTRAGMRFVYCWDPDGALVELVQRPLVSRASGTT